MPRCVLGSGADPWRPLANARSKLGERRSEGSSILAAPSAFGRRAPWLSHRAPSEALRATSKTTPATSPSAAAAIAVAAAQVAPKFRGCDALRSPFRKFSVSVEIAAGFRDRKKKVVVVFKRERSFLVHQSSTASLIIVLEMQRRNIEETHA